jgi:hypothetical protein
MKRWLMMACAWLVLFGTAAVAEEAHERQVQTVKLFHSTDTMVFEALVDAVDHERRVVSLRDPGGIVVDYEVSPELRNLDPVQSGDRVRIESVDELEIAVVRGEGLQPGFASAESVARAPEGARPDLVAITEDTVTAVIEAIDLDLGTVLLRGPEDELTTYTAIDPENLKRAEIGDLVVVRHRLRVAGSVAPADGDK